MSLVSAPHLCLALYVVPANPIAALRLCWSSRDLQVGHGQRDMINRFNLKKRKLIGNTTMDPELSFIMSNMGHVRPPSTPLRPPHLFPNPPHTHVHYSLRSPYVSS